MNAMTFERHVRFLTKNFNVIAARDIDAVKGKADRLAVVLTLDDGFRNNAEIVAPILRRHRVPALFFLSSRHCTPGRYLWFAYLRALEQCFTGAGFMFSGQFWDMAQSRRRTTILWLREALCALRPHPGAMYEAIERELPRLEDFADAATISDLCAGMTEEQVVDLARDPLFEIGGHTTDHPLLTQCTAVEMMNQIGSNKEWIERLSGRPCRVIAYPSGDYDPEVLGVCRSVGFTEGYCVATAGLGDELMERERLGVYSPSTTLLRLKMECGLAIRRVGLRVS